MKVRTLEGIILCALAGGCAGSGNSEDEANKPEIHAVQPAAGPSTGGQTLTLSGKNFAKDMLVKFNGTLATEIRVESSDKMTLILPPNSGNVGKAAVEISLTNGSSQSRDDVFSYYYGVLDFPPLPILATGRGPRAVVVRDLDGDGKLDMAIANGAESNISLFLGLGTGGFSAEQKLPTPAPVVGLVAGDVNGDGKLDLVATGNGTGEVYTLGNSGATPLFTNPASSPAGQGASAIALGDVNGDGKPDLAVANQSPNTVSVLLNRGTGTWEAPVATGAPLLPFGLDFGDLNDDGKPDLAVAGYSEGVVQLLTNGGNGVFVPGMKYTIGERSRVVRIIDLNKDGKLDVAALSETAAGVTVLLNQGGGTFTEPRTYGDGPLPSAVMARDLNGDGLLDLIVASPGGRSVSILAGQGDGTFAEGQPIPLDIIPSSFDVGDLDGDGRVDFAMISLSSGQAVVLLNKSR